MTPPPIVLRLTICERVIVEEATRNVSLINTYTRLIAHAFPSQPQRLDCYAVLTGGLGEATATLVVTELETDEKIYQRPLQLRFENRLTEIKVLFRIGECVFPEPGHYQFTLLLDGEWLAQRLLHVVTKGG